MTRPAPRYFVMNGVRRALACLMAELDSVPAVLYREGRSPLTFQVPLAWLYVPANKATVPLNHRLLRIEPPILVPIEVEPLGRRGQPRSIPLASVRTT